MTNPTTDRLREPDRCLICGENVPRDKGHWHAGIAEAAPAPETDPELMNRSPRTADQFAPDLIAAVEALPGRPMGSISGTPPDPGYVSRAAVLALIESRSVSPSREADR